MTFGATVAAGAADRPAVPAGAGLSNDTGISGDKHYRSDMCIITFA